MKINEISAHVESYAYGYERPVGGTYHSEVENDLNEHLRHNVFYKTPNSATAAALRFLLSNPTGRTHLYEDGETRVVYPHSAHVDIDLYVCGYKTNISVELVRGSDGEIIVDRIDI